MQNFTTEGRVEVKAQEGDAVTRAGRSLWYLPARTRIQCPPPAGDTPHRYKLNPSSLEGLGERLSTLG